MTRASKSATIRQGEREAVVVDRILRGEQVEGETRLKALVRKLVQLAAERKEA